MKNIYYFDELDSTNTYTASQYSKLPNYSTIVADKQTKGKGSSSRIWHSSTKNGLWFSFLIKDEIFWGDAFSIEVLGSIAVWKVLNEKGINATLKWPNDVLVNNKKISGVLVEVCGELETFKYTIIGIGLNVNQKQEEFPSCIQNIATSMFLETNTEYDKQSLLYDIVSNIKLLYTDFKKMEIN